jgi:hypothetical protein
MKEGSSIWIRMGLGPVHDREQDDIKKFIIFKPQHMAGETEGNPSETLVGVQVKI